MNHHPNAAEVARESGLNQEQVGRLLTAYYRAGLEVAEAEANVRVFRAEHSETDAWWVVADLLEDFEANRRVAVVLLRGVRAQEAVRRRTEGKAQTWIQQAKGAA